MEEGIMTANNNETTKKHQTDDTMLIHSGRDPMSHHGALNIPPYQVSTIAFPTTEAFETDMDIPAGDALSYGMHGSPTTHALEDAICQLEQGYRTRLCCSGLTAAVAPLLCYLSAGDHLLMTDSSYTPTKNFCISMLKRMGIEVSWFDPLAGKNVCENIQDNTKAIFLESPGSWVFEVQDVPAIVKVAKQHNIMTFMDNTWSSPLYFKPLQFGVDVSIQAVTKYLAGHSDLMMGAVTTTEEHYPALREGWSHLGLCAAPYDSFLTLRGMRTLSVRMKKHWENALHLAEWLSSRPEVKQVMYPPLPSSAGHDLWKRDFTGASGLLSFVMHRSFSAPGNIGIMADKLQYFTIGHSWGGCNSMIIPCNAMLQRSTNQQMFNTIQNCSLIRIHAGLESVEDLIDDLSNAFSRLKQV